MSEFYFNPEEIEKRQFQKRLSRQATLSFIASFSLISLGLLLLFMSLTLGGLTGAGIETSLLVTFGLVFITLGGLVFPSGLSAYKRLREQALPTWLSGKSTKISRIIQYSPFLMLIILIIGFLLNGKVNVPPILIIVPGILTILIPVFWMIHFASYRLEGGSPQRKWGLLGLGVTITPMVIIFVEGFLLLLGVIIFAVQAASNPALMDEITGLAMRLSMGATDLDGLLTSVQTYLTRPRVLFWVFAAVSVIAPLVEEIFKTLGVWLLAKRTLSPSEGFVAGAISGAGFALIEGLFNLANVVDLDTLLFLVVGRMGGSILHIVTGGMIGWGLASTWRSGKTRTYFGTLFLSTLVHGLWNAFALAAAIIPLTITSQIELTAIQEGLFFLPTLVLGILVFAFFIVFVLHLGKETALDTEKSNVLPIYPPDPVKIPENNSEIDLL